MRLPFIQVTQEAWDYARSLSTLAEIELGRAFMALCDLWRWGMSLGPEDQPPSGVCDSPRAAKLLAGAIGWTGDADALAVILADLGVIELLPVGLRVRGMDRYKRAAEKNLRRTGKRPAETGAAGAGNRQKPAPQTQTQTQTHIASASQKLKGPPFVQPPSAAAASAGQPSLRDHLEADFEALKGKPYAWVDGRGMVDDSAIIRMLGKGNAEEIRRRWGIALRRTKYPECNGLVDLDKHWNAYAAEQTTGPPKRPGARVGAEEVDWSQAKNEVSNEI